MRAVLLGAAVAALAVPAMAEVAGGPARKWMQPTTRAEAEARAKDEFARRDLNKDGFITPEEIRASVEARMGEMKGMAFDRMDTDKNGTISREEFMARPAGPAGGPRIVERRIEPFSPQTEDQPSPGKREMRVMMMHKGPGGGGHMMLMSDTDRDGRISQAEAVAGALKMFDQTDTNHDGTVTLDERRAAMQAWGKMDHVRRMGAMPPPPALPVPPKG